MADKENKTTSEQESKEPSSEKKKRRSLPYRKLAFGAGILLGVLLLFVFVGFLTVRAGYLDGYSNGWLNSYVEDQFVKAFDDMGVEMESDEFSVVFSPFRLETKNAKFNNKKTGDKIATIEELNLDLTMLDVFGMSTSRDVVLDKTEIKGLDLYVKLDENGISNFDGIEMAPPTSSVKFQYATTEITISDSRFHFGDEVRAIKGTAKNMAASFTPSEERKPDSEDLSFKYDFRTSKSTLSFGESEVDPIDVISKGLISPEGMEIDSLTIKSPVTETEMSGKLNDWASLTYDLEIESKVNLSTSSETFNLGSTIAGIGNFKGKVKGKGLTYKVTGEVTSDNLAAEGIRLRALKVIGSGDGESGIYKASGKAIAEMLTFGQYKVDYLSLIGNIRGNGVDFRWFGELQAAAVNSPLGSIAGLYLSDAVAEYNEGKLDGSFNGLRARSFSNDSFSANGIQTGRIILDSNGSVTNASIPDATATELKIGDSKIKNVRVGSARVSTDQNETNVNAKSVSVGSYTQGDTKLGRTNASGVRITNRSGTTDINAESASTDSFESGSTKAGSVATKDLKVTVAGNETRVSTGNVTVARVETDAAILGKLNIAGVRLTVREGIIEGETADFEAGNVDLRENGKLSGVVARNPVFVLEPSGKYRASLDMSLGSGVLGSITLGEAKAKVTADNQKVVLDQLDASMMDGKVNGDAVIALDNSTRSRVKANFADLDISKLAALQGGEVVPIEGKTNGAVDVTFPGRNFNKASGTLDATIEANAGSEDRGFIPVSGEIGVEGVDGFFNIDFARMQTAKSSLNATGSFDLDGFDSKLNLNLQSSDALEIDRIARVLELSPTLESQLDAYDVEPKGAFAFNGNLTGNLSSPVINGRASLESLVAQGRNLGRLTTNIATSPDSVKLSEGLLQSTDGGSLKFVVDIPGSGGNNTTVDAQLNQMDLANILVLVQKNALPEQLRDITGKATGSLELRGLPNDMRGSADLRTTNGTVNGQSFESVVAKADFNGKSVELKEFLATVGTGRISGSGVYDAESTVFDFKTNAEKIPAEKILAFLPKFENSPDIEGIINANGTISGRYNDTKTYKIDFEGFGDRVSINGSRLGRVDFAGNTENSLLTATAATNFNREKQVVRATVNFAEEEIPFSAVSDLQNAPIGPYIKIFRPEERGSVSITGSVTGKLVAAGNLTTLNADGQREFTIDNIRGTADFAKAGFRFDEIPLDATEPVKISFSSREITFDNAQFAGGGSNLVITGSKAIADDAVNNLAVTGRLNLGIVRAFSRNSLRNVFISGIADLAIRLSGVNETARLNGTALIERGSASTFVGSNRITFERLNGRVRFTTNQIQFESITGTLGGGQVRASGGALLADDLSLNKIRIDVQGSNITAPLPDDFITTGNAQIQINGRLVDNRFDTIVSGRVVARRSLYRKDLALADLINSRREATLTQTVNEPSAGGIEYTPPRFDIRIIGRNALIVRNNLADLTASLDLRMLGNSNEIALAGRITSTDGVLFFRDDRYEIQRGVVEFPPNTSIEPVVSIAAEADISGYQVRINLNGKLTDSETLALVTSSNPSLPENDILSLITRGRLANTSGGLPVVAQGGINAAARIVTDEIINRPVAKATDRLFGLNRFELDPLVQGERGNSTARLTVGRQINRNLSATYSTNLSEDQNQVLSVEYRLSNRLSVVAAYEQRSLTNVTQRRNEFRIEIRLRKRF